jgi:HECT-domain (ubiquitin-transferase)
MSVHVSKWYSTGPRLQYQFEEVQPLALVGFRMLGFGPRLELGPALKELALTKLNLPRRIPFLDDLREGPDPVTHDVPQAVVSAVFCMPQELAMLKNSCCGNGNTLRRVFALILHYANVHIEPLPDGSWCTRVWHGVTNSGTELATAKMREPPQANGLPNQHNAVHFKTTAGSRQICDSTMVTNIGAGEYNWDIIQNVLWISSLPPIQNGGSRFPCSTWSTKPECELDPENDLKGNEGLHMPRFIQGPELKLIGPEPKPLNLFSDRRPHPEVDLSSQPIPGQCTNAYEVLWLKEITEPAYNTTDSAKVYANSRITMGTIPMSDGIDTPSTQDPPVLSRCLHQLQLMPKPGDSAMKADKPYCLVIIKKPSRFHTKPTKHTILGSYSKFIGRCLDLATFHQWLLDAYFTVCFYKVILKSRITHSDLESIDADLFCGKTGILENNSTVLFFETFTEDRFRKLVTIELRPGSTDMPVTEEITEEYIKTVIEYCNSHHPTKVFDEHKCELLIDGMSDINADDWMRIIGYWGCELNDKVIQWSWQVVQGRPTPCKYWLLQFATGTSQIFVFATNAEMFHHSVVILNGIMEHCPCEPLWGTALLFRTSLLPAPCGWFRARVQVLDQAQVALGHDNNIRPHLDYYVEEELPCTETMSNGDEFLCKPKQSRGAKTCKQRQTLLLGKLMSTSLWLLVLDLAYIEGFPGLHQGVRAGIPSDIYWMVPTRNKELDTALIQYSVWWSSTKYEMILWSYLQSNTNDTKLSQLGGMSTCHGSPVDK